MKINDLRARGGRRGNTTNDLSGRGLCVRDLVLVSVILKKKSYLLRPAASFSSFFARSLWLSSLSLCIAVGSLAAGRTRDLYALFVLCLCELRANLPRFCGTMRGCGSERDLIDFELALWKLEGPVAFSAFLYPFEVAIYWRDLIDSCRASCRVSDDT
jgi:hypothetical protein